MIIKPKGKQIEVLGIRDKGHFVVLGTAGSGKTTIALLRAITLANLPGQDEVLLVTFNCALVEYMKGIENISGRLTIENYHKFARGYLSFRGKMSGYGAIMESDVRERLIEKAVNEIREAYPDESTLKRSKNFFCEEIQFIQEFGCDTKEKYFAIERTGRAEAFLKKEKRAFIYLVYEKYLELRKKENYSYDWYDLAMNVCKEMDADTSKRKYKHIVVDEGQDFSPSMIKSLVKAIPEDGSFTFFGDVAQQIYGNKLSWKESGIKAPSIWRFAINYRNPETVVAFSKALTNSNYWRKSEYIVECEESNAKGPKPVLIKFLTEKLEREWVVKRAIDESKKASVVIVCRNRNDIGAYLHELRKNGCTAIEIEKKTPGFGDKKEVYLSTFHSVKGLEFYNVFIPALSADKIPDPERLGKADEVDDVYADEIKLLYVAVTRAKYGLFMSYSGTLTSIFPTNTDTVNYQEVD